MDRTLFRTTAMVGFVLSLGVTAADAGGRHGGGGAPMRVFPGTHAGPRPGFGGFHGVPPVSGVIRAQPGMGAYGAGGYGGGGYAGQRFGGAGYGGYGHGPAVYSLQRSTAGYGGRGAYGTGRYAGGSYGYGSPYAGQPYGGRGGERFRRGRGYGYGAGALGAAAGLAVGYAVAGGGYSGGYGGGYDAGYANYDAGSGYGVAAPVDTGYASGEVPLTVRYGEPALLPSTGGGLFGTGGYALDGQVQDVGYGGPHVAGYGYGGTTGWSQGIAPAGGLAVYSPGVYGPGPRVVTIPSNYGGGYGGATTTHCTCVPATAGY